MALTPEERQAITGLFERLRENGLAEKDSEAEALINQLIRRTADSPYMLVQSVLIQEQQIGEYETYMDQQEDRIKELEEQLNGGRAPAQPSSGGFLGGARRGAAPSPRDSYQQRDANQDDRGSGMPSIGSRSGPSRYDTSPSQQPEQPWRGRDPSYAAGQGGMGAPQGQQPPQQGGGGGFLRTAAAMAAGVAGGALLSNTLGGMFGGHKGGEAQAGHHGNSESRSEEASHRGGSDNDPGNYDSNVHEAGVEEGDWGAGGGGGDDSDLEI
ncbi:MAG: DUF2076 family protein [Hyphomicrobiaceae bacterium]